MKSMNIKTLLAAAFVAAAFLIGSAHRAEAGQPRIGVLIYRYDDTYISTVRNALTKAFEGKAAISMQDGKGDQATQNDQVDIMLAKGMDAVLVNMVDAQAAAGVLNKIKAAGVPVVFFNREPDLNILKTYDKAIFVGTNAADAGKMQGDIIKKLWTDHPEYDLNKDGKFQYVMFKGEPDNPEAIAQNSMESALAANQGKIELVIANNDSMAMGAIAALSNVGYNLEGSGKFIPVVGVDATEQAVDAINKGIMSATVKQDGEAMGQAISVIVLNMIAGKKPLDGTEYKYDESGIAVRIPYSTYAGKK